MIDYRRKIDAFRDVRSCEDYIKLARHNNHDKAVSYAERKIITLKYQSDVKHTSNNTRRGI